MFLNHFICFKKDVIEIAYNNNTRAYFTAIFKSFGKNATDYVFIDSVLARHLGILDQEQVTVTNIHRDKNYASTITVQPLSFDDWQILELNLEKVQNDLLHQIRVVYKNQIIPIWIGAKICIFVKITEIDPDNCKYACINDFTKVFINEPNQGKMEKDGSLGNVSIVSNVMAKCMNFSEQTNSLAEFCSDTQLTFTTKIELKQNEYKNQTCSSLTSIYISKKHLQTYQFETNLNKILVKFKIALSPYIKYRNKDVAKRVINLVETTYNDDYLQQHTDTHSTYALLHVLDDTVDEKCIIEVSEFLFKQCRAPVFSKIQISTLREDEVLNKIKKSITLKAACFNTNSVMKHFAKFIDDNSLCLCPLILTNNQIIELKTGDDGNTIACKIYLDDSPFIAINSNLLQHLSIKIESDLANFANLPTTCCTSLESKQFSLKINSNTWFNNYVNLITEHLNKNLHNNVSHKFGRNLVVQGTKGSGKTTLCKYVCNLNSQKNHVFCQYFNCQYFMGKNVDGINEQLKLIYEESIWSDYSIVVLDDFDFLIENVNSETDPNAKLYCYQLIEVFKMILLNIWNRNANVLTIVTSTSTLSELPSMFHCLEGHGLFTEFIDIKSPTKPEIIEIVQNFLTLKNVRFEEALLNAFSDHLEGCVFKDIEKLMEKLLFQVWNKNESFTNDIRLSDVQNELYNYLSINMLETNFFKSKSILSWNLIGGMKSARDQLIEAIIWPTKYGKFYKELGMKQATGTLLYGPTGCGKTLIVSALANESKMNFISVKGPELLSKYIGTSEHNVRELFRKAEKAKPCIIFFDEFDSLAPKRGHDSTGVTDRVVNQLLTQLDGVEQLNGVYLIAATSRPDLIDQALLRPGRIDRYVYISYPNTNEIKQMIKIYCKQVRLSDDVDLDEIAELCDNFTGADIKSLVCDALIRAFHRTQNETNANDFTEIKLNDKLDNVNLASTIIINTADLVSSVRTIEKSINRNERKKLSKIYENWKNTKEFRENGEEKKARATLA